MSKMSDMSLLIEEPRLFDNLCSTLYFGVGFELVKKNKGAAGIDGVSISDFETDLDEELSLLQQEQCNWTYQPSPARRDGKGVRLLGIPTVRDHVVQTTLKLLLEPIFEPSFSAHSYGFRPGRSAHQALAAQQQIIIRRRIRSRLVSQQKRRQFLYENLVKRGVPIKQASKAVFSNNKRWALSNTRAVTKAYPNSWFINLKGQEIRSDQKLAHWFDVSQWIIPA